jgi:hypothetical protein
MFDEDIIFSILDKYDRYFQKAPLSGVVYFVELKELRSLDKEINCGKIIGDRGSFYLIRSGIDNHKIRKHLCFKSMEQAIQFSNIISIDELRMIF